MSYLVSIHDHLFWLKLRRLTHSHAHTRTDESHKVRSMKTLVTEAVLELQAKYRWCITGTPLQNDISELHPIFAFLKIHIPLKQRQNVDYISTVLKQHMVRRTKKSLQTALTILPQRQNRVELTFTDAERALYDYLERVLYKQIRIWRTSGQGENVRSASSLLYLRLKQSELILMDFL